jgi:hypothetical protein
MSGYMESVNSFVKGIASDMSFEKYLVNDNETYCYLNEKLFEATNDLEIEDFLDDPSTKSLKVRLTNNDGLPTEVYDLTLYYGKFH